MFVSFHGKERTGTCGERETDLAVYSIHCLDEDWKRLPEQVYAILDQTGILDGYVFPCYDTLRTLGREYRSMTSQNSQKKRARGYESVSRQYGYNRKTQCQIF